MPIVMVYGLRGDSQYLDLLRGHLEKAVTDVRILGVAKNQVSVMFIAQIDLPKGTDILVEIKGILIKPECTVSVQNTLAESILQIIKGFRERRRSSQDRKHEPSQRLCFIRVLVYPFDPVHQGFAISHDLEVEEPKRSS